MFDLRKMRIDLYLVQSATERANSYAEMARIKLQQYDSDISAWHRQQARQCRYCYYMRSNIAGQAFTLYACEACGRTETHPNAAVPLLCPSCSDALKLCRVCGGDMEGNQRNALDLSRIPWNEARPNDE